MVSPQPSTRRLSSQQRHFRDALRHRDTRCVITGLAAPEFVTLEATHIVPATYYYYHQSQPWNQNRCDRDDRGGADQIVFSPQNGLLLTSTVHALFDRYFFAIQPNVCHYLFNEGYSSPDETDRQAFADSGRRTTKSRISSRTRQHSRWTGRGWRIAHCILPTSTIA